MRMILAGATVSVLGMASSAVAQVEVPNEAQSEAIRHFVGASLTGERCSGWEMDIDTARQLFRDAGLDVSDLQDGGRFSYAVALQNFDMQVQLDDLTPNQVCAVGLVLYGPNGQNVPDLLTSR